MYNNTLTLWKRHNKDVYCKLVELQNPKKIYEATKDHQAGHEP